jgi:mono/diheme cytochrome c family protein
MITLRRSLLLPSLSIFLLACAGANSSAPSAVMPSYEARQPIGFYRLLFDEYQSFSRATLERSAVSWKAMATALLTYHRQADPTLLLTEAAYVELLSRRYGFVVPTRIANWPTGQPQAPFTRPLGIVHGSVTAWLPRVELEVANNGCATCHAGVLYDRTGLPTREAWLGLPSTSINLGRYAEEAFLALERATQRPREEFLANVRALFPAVSEAELATLRNYYLPALAKRIPRLRAAIGGFTPYSNGGPGLTNGVATIKFYFGVIDDKQRDPSQVAFTSIPDLAGLRLRTSILWDGVYSPPGWPHSGPLPATLTPAQQRDGIGGVVAIVTVGTLGVTPEVAAANVPRVREAVQWMFEQYQPPPFPAPIDRPLAQRGGKLYEEHCSHCHGSYQETAAGLRLVQFPNRVSRATTIGTDPERAGAVREGAGNLFARTAMGAHLEAVATGGYIAPPLTSLWATAPYLHNGSVPTLYHLMHASSRPAKFQVGGHRLDFAKVGIDGSERDGVYQYPAAYHPWTLPEIYDTSTPGRRNGGHEEPFDELGEDDKRALLEFLKRV